MLKKWHDHMIFPDTQIGLDFTLTHNGRIIIGSELGGDEHKVLFDYACGTTTVHYYIYWGPLASMEIQKSGGHLRNGMYGSRRMYGGGWHMPAGYIKQHWCQNARTDLVEVVVEQEKRLGAGAHTGVIYAPCTPAGGT
ncbi:hypothetical protein DL96DRAFT_1557338 [Flagelloscypha sp. PMI_526]|nr:hypothetical protein DL96DRAFT_1557338 [Flagelloscypha sp. PMI_526]